MPDVFSAEKRSEVMSLIRSTNTKPERVVRSLLHRMGYRFRLHRKDLPGRPDVVLSKYHTVVFVHGCFWHAHDCHLFRIPSSNQEYWQKKLIGNRDRDQIQQEQLKQAGWRVLIVFECELRGQSALAVENLLNNLAVQIRLSV